MNCYGDGTVYRGVRSENSGINTYTWHDLAYAKGVPSLVTNAMLAFEQKHVALVEKCAALEAANRDLQAWFDALKADFDAQQADAELGRNMREKLAILKAKAEL